MIAPTKYMDLNSCVLRLAAVLLDALRQSSVVRLDEAEQILVAAAGERGRRNLSPTLSFLFLIKKIAFMPDADAIVLSSEPNP